MTHLDLFSGIGGFALAAKWAGLTTVQFVEYDAFCQKILTKNFPGVPIHGDIKSFRADGIVSPFLLTGGYPCQPFSQAGKRLGKADPRHLWPEMFRVIQECRPTWVLAENVSGHIKLGVEEVLTDLESAGYQSQVFHIGAVAKDAPHRRMRLWIVANANGRTNGTNGGKEREEEGIQGVNRQEGLSGVSGGTGSDTEDVANSKYERCLSSEYEERSRYKEGVSQRDGEDVANSECNTTGRTHRGDSRFSSGGREEQSLSKGSEVWSNSGNSSEDVPDSDNTGLQGGIQDGVTDKERREESGDGCATECRTGRERVRDSQGESIPGLGGTLSDGVSQRLDEDYWMMEPDIPRIGVGIPDRAKRLKAIGNAIVPAVAYEIMRWMR